MSPMETARFIQCRLVDAALIGQSDPELYLDASEAIIELLKRIDDLEAIVSNQRHEIAHLHAVEGSY